MRSCLTLLHHGWADWESGCILAALRRYFDFSVEIATPDGREVESIGGVRARSDVSFASADAEDAGLVLVIGSDSWLAGEDAAVSALLRRADSSGVPIGAICAGTVAAAHAGLLDSRAHTSNERGFLEKHCAAYRGAAHYRDTHQAVTADNLVTSCGVAPISFAVAIMHLLAPARTRAIADYEKLLRREHF